MGPRVILPVTWDLVPSCHWHGTSCHPDTDMGPRVILTLTWDLVSSWHWHGTSCHPANDMGPRVILQLTWDLVSSWHWHGTSCHPATDNVRILTHRATIGDKTILRPCNLHNGTSYTGTTASLYWIRAQIICVYASHPDVRVGTEQCI